MIQNRNRILADRSLQGEIGNGRATAILLARQGARVVLVDFNEQWALDTKEMIDAEGGESVVVQADVTDESSVQNAVAKAVKTYGKIDILVNVGKLMFLTQSMSSLLTKCVSWRRRGNG